MALLNITSPHAHGPTSTSWVMLQVILATTPGVLALTYFFGFGNIINIIWAVICALSFEAISLKIRKRPIAFYLKDYSAVVTAVLLGIAMPPYAPWWVVMVGIAFAIFIAKHLYGGMGYNPFNPAMVAYVILLISLPVQMTQWAKPLTLDGNFIGPIQAFLNNFGFIDAMDGRTAATPLDILKQNNSLMMEQLFQQNELLDTVAGVGWQWVNAGFLLGGLYLLARKIFTWHTPVGLLVALIICSVIGYDGGSSASGGSPLFHLFSGATMLGAFFIATDPVSSAVSNKGRLAYGACIGVFVYVIRVYGAYPDAMAFAVLLMNFAAPFIDHYTQPRTYGHSKKGGKK
jgi:electron transport complex protein RnfD